MINLLAAFGAFCLFILAICLMLGAYDAIRDILHTRNIRSTDFKSMSLGTLLGLEREIATALHEKRHV